MPSIRLYKKIIKWFFWITIGLIVLLSFDAAHEPEKWRWFKIDFDGKDHIISAYGSLIGGVLAFLSILFVLFQVYEQREQILNEKKESEKEKLEEQIDFLRLISSFLGSITKDIENQGNRFKEFYEKEKVYPTLSNILKFSVNHNFIRIIEMDYEIVYKSFRAFLKDENEWEKKFLNFYRNIDFYSNAIPHLRENFSSQLKDKVELKFSIQKGIQDLLDQLLKIRNYYIESFPIPPFDLKNNPNFEAINRFWWNYKKYTDYIDQSINKESIDSDLTDLKRTYFEPFFEKMEKLRQSQMFTSLEEIQLIEKVGELIVKIKQLEVFALNYANDIEKSYIEYFSVNSKNLKAMIELKTLIDSKLN